MSKYTIELGEIIDNIWKEYHPENDIAISASWETALEETDIKIEFARPKIFSFEYPCYGGEEEKQHLEKDILSDYFFREINVDSVARWQMMLRNKLHKIMPKYIAWYDAQAKLIASDVLNPYHIDETINKQLDKTVDKTVNTVNDTDSNATNSTETESTNTTQGTDLTTSNRENKFSNTPQALMQTGKDYVTNLTKDNNVDDNQYSSTVNNNDNSSSTDTVKSTQTTTGTENDAENKVEDVVRSMKGNATKLNNAQLIKQYQDAIINIEHAIIDELNDLFYLMY